MQAAAGATAHAVFSQLTEGSGSQTLKTPRHDKKNMLISDDFGISRSFGNLVAFLDHVLPRPALMNMVYIGTIVYVITAARNGTGTQASPTVPGTFRLSTNGGTCTACAFQ
eukprot:Skav234538  [mRNA]  locus=scaffold2556:191395:191727:+ [translate_table: standard]